MRIGTRTSRSGRATAAGRTAAGRAAGLAAVALVVSACSVGVAEQAADSEPASPESSAPEPKGGSTPAEGKVIQPGKPGEKAETLPPDATVPESEYNDADVEFVQMMIPHHAQALEMGKLARSRAEDQQVQSVADRIADAQGAEIIGMSAWLQGRGLAAPSAEDLQNLDQGGDHGADHGGQHGGQHRGQHGAQLGGHSMPGMLSEAEMAELADAEGARFDELYLRNMIRHHQGALDMAGRVMTEGSDLRVEEIATEVAAGQSAEIGRMKDLLRDL